VATEVETKTIAPTTLGRYKNEIEAAKGATKKELKALGYEDNAQAELMVKKSIALRCKVSVKKLDEMLAELKKNNPTVGVRETDKISRDALVVETQSVLGLVNLAVACKRGQVMTIEDKALAFDILGDTGEKLTNHLKDSFAPVGGMTMLWNPQCQVQEAEDGLAVYIGGWADGSKNLRFQYAPRKCPISKRAGYRDDSFAVPITDIHPVEPEPEPEVVPEPEMVNEEVAEVQS